MGTMSANRIIAALISLLILAPFLVSAYLLPLEVALPVGILCSSLFWWVVGFVALNYPNYEADDGKGDQLSKSPNGGAAPQGSSSATKPK